jgi:hypothetical protein
MVVQGPTMRLDRWIRADMKIVLRISEETKFAP